MITLKTALATYGHTKALKDGSLSPSRATLKFEEFTPQSAAFRANGPWQSTVGLDLKGRQLGVIGLGKIGSRVAAVGLAFGMDVVAWSQNLTRERADAVGVRLAPTKASLLETSDFVSIHLVLSARTRGLLGREELRRMKPTAYLINTARSELIDEDALLEALRRGKIAGLALDTFRHEPPGADNPVLQFDQVIATPHTGSHTDNATNAMGHMALSDCLAVLRGQEPQFRIV